jgi:hypothetical protein
MEECGRTRVVRSFLRIYGKYLALAGVLGASLLPLSFWALSGLFNFGPLGLVEGLFLLALGLFPGPVVGVFLGLILIFSVRGARRMKNVYEAFARQLGGQLVNVQTLLFGRVPQGVILCHSGGEARLELESVLVSSSSLGYGSTHHVGYDHYTNLMLRGLRTPASCHVAAGRHKKELDSFDDQFVVETDDQTRAGAILTPQVQQELLGLKQWLAKPRRQAKVEVEVMIEDGVQRLRYHGLLYRTEDLMTFYEFGGRLYDQLSSA